MFALMMLRHRAFAVVCAVAFVVLFASVAFADGAVSQAAVNLTPWWQLGLNALGALGPVLLAIVAAFLAKHVKNENLRQALLDGVQHEAQGMYGALAAASKSFTTVDMHSPELAQAVNNVGRNFPAAIKLFGKSGFDVEQMVLNAFGGLLATDPNVSISPPAQQTAAGGATAAKPGA
jgi:hypothetical protein